MIKNEKGETSWAVENNEQYNIKKEKRDRIFGLGNNFGLNSYVRNKRISG
jgi:hypothetical protein